MDEIKLFVAVMQISSIHFTQRGGLFLPLKNNFGFYWFRGILPSRAITTVFYHQDKRGYRSSMRDV